MKSLPKRLNSVDNGRMKDFISNWRTSDKRKAYISISSYSWDVLEHVEDPFSFLRDIRPKSTYKIIHLPLDISVRNVLLGNLIKFRAAYGHLHYFTKDLALQMLRDAGYEVIDYLYTWQENPLQFIWSENRKSPRKLARKLAGFIARKILGVPSLLFFALQKDLAARVIGRWILMVLAK